METDDEKRGGGSGESVTFGVYKLYLFLAFFKLYYVESLLKIAESLDF